MLKIFKSFLLICIYSFFNMTLAKVSLPAIFGDHMVLQQTAEVKLWGWANPNEEITIIPSWDNKPVKVKADNEAKWLVNLITPKSGGPYQIKIQGYNAIIIDDVLIGEVWLCSGQSNMEWTPSAGIDDAKEEIKKADYPSIRFFTVTKKSSEDPQLDLEGEWVVCTPKTMEHFSAAGYFFGQKIHTELNVPVGLINSSWGGTPAEIWTPEEAINENEVLLKASQKLNKEPWGPNQPGRAYNAMIHPIVSFKLAGVLWYQGETNTQNADTYAELLSTLIKSWRKKWEDNFSFYFAQIAPYNYGEDNFNGVTVRDQQLRTLDKVNKTGMIVTSDIGNLEDIHPKNKKDVGLRFANLALNKTYGKTDLAYSGPLYKEFKIEKDKIRVHFNYSDGLKSNGKPEGFEVAGEDGKFYTANAKIEENDIVVWSNKVKNPKHVRYGWNNTAEPALTNNSGLPASSFTSEEY